ncbi:MAG: carboxymuconolactone decarboxylase family protein [Caulobacter sp.]|nr:carboxymuconolactone decarboxylase family protein [Caulobacter sp.]
MSARITPQPAPFAPAIQARLDAIMPPGAAPLTLFTTLARDERLFSRFMDGGLLDKGHLTVREREIVIHRICGLNRAAYEWGVHAALFAPHVGLEGAQLAATVSGAEAGWAPKEALLMDFCAAVNARADVDDALWARLGAEFSEMARLELMLLAGFYRTVSLLVNALRLEPEPGAVPFPA